MEPGAPWRDSRQGYAYGVGSAMQMQLQQRADAAAGGGVLKRGLGELERWQHHQQQQLAAQQQMYLRTVRQRTAAAVDIAALLGGTPAQPVVLPGSSFGGGLASPSSKLSSLTIASRAAVPQLQRQVPLMTSSPQTQAFGELPQPATLSELFNTALGARFDLRSAPSSRPPLPISYFPFPPSLIPCSQWEKGECIGSGSFGHVYRGFNSEHGQFCAIKEVLVISNDQRSKEQLRQLNQEVYFLKQLSHQNIVQYYGSIMTDHALSIYMEYVSKGSIHVLLAKYGPFKESMIRSYTAQILSGLAFLHERRHIHRDIKGANILVGADNGVKLADFGLAKHIETLTAVHTSNRGTPCWMAPEVILSTHNGKGYNLSADIWSLGCTVIEMATGKPPLHGYEPVAAMFKIVSNTYVPEIPDNLSDVGKDFLQLCLQRDPAYRPTAAELMNHPFVQNQEGASSGQVGGDG